MLGLAQGIVSGNYAVSSPELLSQGEFLIAHEFAAPRQAEGEGLINEALAQYIIDHYSGQKIYAAATIAGALHGIAPNLKLAGEFPRISSNTLATKGGTWSELQMARSMAGPEKHKSILAGQACHVGRIALQAVHPEIGLTPLLPPHLPNIFDEDSMQWWCRKRAWWPIREIPTYLELKRRDQL